MLRKYLLYSILACFSFISVVNAQLAEGATKFLGNITTSGNIRSDFMQYWNQITAENECKWSSVEGTRDQMNWSGCDRVYDFAKQQGIPTKFHTLVWGSQYPGWMDNLSQAEQLAEIEEWYDGAQARYPDLDMIDVVNEAVPGHAPAPFKNALGGDGQTGYDWIIESFRMARERWPDALLIYNDYNALTWQRSEFIDLMNAIKGSGYVDAMGLQAHGLENFSASNLQDYLDEIYNSVGLPMLISEYDVARTNDTEQLNIMQAQFPVFWEHPQVAAVTIWGYVVDRTWVDGSGLIQEDGTDRPAMTWLKNYVSSNKNVQTPINWGNSGPSFSNANAVSIPENTTQVLTLEASGEGTISFAISGGAHSSQFRINGADLSFAQPPAYQNGASNEYTVTVEATDDVGSTTQDINVTVLQEQGPYQGSAIHLPGLVEFENYDVGGNGYAYYDDSEGSETGVDFRTSEDVDIEESTDVGGGYNIGWATAGEWLEYSVIVDEGGVYDVTFRVACDAENRTISLSSNGTTLISDLAIPFTGGWQEWQDLTVTDVSLNAGEQVLRMTMGDSNYVNLNYMSFALQEEEPTGISTTEDHNLKTVTRISLHGNMLELHTNETILRTEVFTLQGEKLTEFQGTQGMIANADHQLLLVKIHDIHGLNSIQTIISQ